MFNSHNPAGAPVATPRERLTFKGVKSRTEKTAIRLRPMSAAIKDPVIKITTVRKPPHGHEAGASVGSSAWDATHGLDGSGARGPTVLFMLGEAHSVTSAPVCDVNAAGEVLTGSVSVLSFSKNCTTQ